MNKILTIFFKEFKEVLRDRKTVIFVIVLPTLVMPVLFQFLFKFMEKQERKARSEKLTIAMIGGEKAPNLEAMFRDNEGYEIVAGDWDAEAFIPAIKEGKIKAGLVFPEDADQIIADEQQLDITIYYNNASMTSRIIPRTREVIDAYNESVQKERMVALGLGGMQRNSLIEPVTLKRLGIADDREIWGERIGGILPYLFIAFCFLGALFPAIDIGAGEKERGTLETLLLTPVPRFYLVFGKFLVVFCSGLIAAFLCVISMGVSVAFGGEAANKALGNILTSIGPIDFFAMCLILLPMAAVFGSVLLSISIYAKSFKEAQSYAGPLQFLFILPAFIALLPGVELTWSWALVPITNISLAIKEIVKGTIDYGMLFLIFGSTTVFALLALLFCVKWFDREHVLFRN